MANTSYATLAELKARVSIAADDSGADGLLQQMLNSAAFLVDGFTREARQGYEAFSASASETRVFADDGGFVALDDALVLTSVSKAGVVLSAGQSQVYPYQDASAPRLPITAIILRDPAAPLFWSGLPISSVVCGRVEVVAQWGFCDAANRPPVIKEATLLQASLMVQRLGHTPAPRAVGQLDPSVAAILNGLARRAYGV